MKKNFTCLALVGILVISSLLTYCGSSKKNIITYHLSPVICEMMLGGVTPEKFCESNGKDTYLEGCYDSAYVDEDGCLILSLDKKTASSWKNSIFVLHVLQGVLGESRDIGIEENFSEDFDFLGYIKNAQTCGYDISDDYTQVIESPEDNSWYFPVVMPACTMMQVFDGKSCDEIRVEFLELNEKGEIIERIVWPETQETVLCDNGN